ncbi:MAG: extracellular solute-binding protein [Gammaproteobacteria bacterium]|nr:extracellular solute-binding protein [Gammaproteobacteria bacterium]
MRTIAVSLVLMLLVACGDTGEPDGAPLIVYASEDDPANLEPLFAAFTSATGIPLTPVWGSSSANTKAVIGKQGMPADVLVSSNVADVVLAAYEGALRPISTAALDAVHSALKDPDGQWVSLQRRVTVIAAAAKIDELATVNFETLATPAYLGKLCLSSIANSVNQSLIAWLIEDLGRKPAERVVRGWVRNLAAPPFASEAELAAALESGACKFGILSDRAVTTGMKITTPSPSYIDVSAIGVGRHAQNPERAQQLVAWLIVHHAPREGGEAMQRNVAIAGWGNEEARLLAERAGYD